MGIGQNFLAYLINGLGSNCGILNRFKFNTNTITIGRDLFLSANNNYISSLKDIYMKGHIKV